MSLQVNRAPVPAFGIDKYILCFSVESKYPPFSAEYMDYDKTNDIKLSGKGFLQFGHAKTCPENKGEIRFSYEHSTTQEARETLVDKWFHKKCMEDADSIAWRGREALPLTKPCILTALDATKARKYSYKINFTKVEKLNTKLWYVA